MSSVGRPLHQMKPDRSTVEFGIGVGEYEGVVRVSGAFSKSCFPKPRRLNAASKPITFTGLGSNSSPSGRFGGG